MPKVVTVQQNLDELRRAYAESEASVKADADPACTICGGNGWHWGWRGKRRKPVMLRCPCVDQKRGILSIVQN
ncbi:MAG: hypothetical protein JO266_20935 [Acidobacteria bacterium]|nr:hypothetical protein [Acidobacteriota bacterium]MBV9483800.1 hypothetical protein [Acidobacteriota bacterium]